MPKQTFFNLPDEKRTHIELVAIDEFASKTYESASISAIVANAGIAKGSFYQYFESKQDLFLHILKLANLKRSALVSQMKPNRGGMDTFAYLRWMLQLALLFQVQHPKLSRIVYRAVTEDLAFITEQQNGTQHVGGFYFNDLITQGLLHGEIAPWVDGDMISFLLETTFHYFGKYILQRMEVQPQDFPEEHHDILESQDVQDLIDNFMDILRAGIERDPEIRRQFFVK